MKKSFHVARSNFLCQEIIYIRVAYSHIDHADKLLTSAGFCTQAWDSLGSPARLKPVGSFLSRTKPGDDLMQDSNRPGPGILHEIVPRLGPGKEASNRPGPGILHEIIPRLGPGKET